MRILLVSNCDLNPNQGSGYVITGYSKLLTRRGIAVDAYGPSDYTILPLATRAKRLRVVIGYTLLAIKKLLASKYDVVELWGAESWLATILISLFRPRVLIVSRSNGLEPHIKEINFPSGEKFIPRLITKSLEQSFFKADVMTVVSDFDANFAIRKHYKPRQDILVLPNPLKDEWLGQKINHTRDLDFGFVGTWVERKGVGLIPDAMKLIWNKYPSINFTFVGIGEEGRSQLLSIFGEDQRCKVIDQCDRDALMAYYQNFKIILMPSSYESFGLVATEGMSCGAALIAGKTGVAYSLTSGLNYIQMQHHTPESLSCCMEKLIVDDAYRSEIAASGYRWVQDLQWQSSVERLVEFYDRNLNGKLARLQ